MDSNQIGNQRVKQRLLPFAAGSAKHRRLLLGFAGTADHGDARVGPGRGQPLADFAPDVVGEAHARSDAAVVEVGKHEVLPDQQAKLIADL